MAINRVRRRGSIYTITLGTAAIVSILGYASLTMVRIQRKSAVAMNDTSAAAGYARGGLEMSLHRIANEANWRPQLAAATWDVDQSIGSVGQYRFTGEDPIDADLADSQFDPVVITSTGKHGQAVQVLQARVEFRQTGLRCLEPALHANGTLTIDGATLRSDRPISSNQTLLADNGAQVYADAEAAVSVSTANGAVFHQSTTTTGTWPRDMPNTLTVLNYYTSNGTTIDYNSLLTTNVITNPGGEAGTTGWVARDGCTLASSASKMHTGTNSIYLSSRSSPQSGPSQDVTSSICNGTVYDTEVWVYPLSKTDSFRIAAEIKTDLATNTVLMSGWVNCPKNEWTRVSGNKVLSWTGALTSIIWYVESSVEDKGFYIDDALLKDEETAVIEKTLLSPSANPLGGGVDTDGIYVIDCAGQPLTIRNSRIVGTLAILNPSMLKIDRSVHWAPAKTEWDGNLLNLPALMASGDVNVAITNSDLSESSWSTNFNPAGTAYFGTTDSQNDDNYPSSIHGLIYTTGNMTFENQPTIHGAVVSDGNITVKGSELNLMHNNTYFYRNASPGFQDAIVPSIVAGSIRKVTN